MGGCQGGKKGEMEQEWKNRKRSEQEACYLLWHHLFDLRFHVAIHCFGFIKKKKQAQGERQLSAAVIQKSRYVFTRNTC